jgi:hypothetical protein
MRVGNHMRLRRALYAGLFLVTAVRAALALTDEELEGVRDGFASRRDAYLTGYLEEPFYEFDEGIEAFRQRLKEAHWIWGPEENAASKASIGIRYFRCVLTLPNDRTLKKAYCAIAADNFCDLSVNGAPIGRASGFHHAELFEVTKHLERGSNTLAIAAHNAGEEANPAGVLGLVHVEFEEGEPLLVVTGENWRVSDEPAPGWEAPGFDDADWEGSQVLGPSGCAPWGKVSLRLDVRVSQYVFSRLTFALAALHLQTDTEEANAAIIEAIAQIRQEQQSAGEFGLHWMGGLFYRIYGLFGPGGTMEGRLSDDATNAIWSLFADWAQSAARIADANPEHTWRIWGSENHSAQRDATSWAAASMIASDPRADTYRYDDGTTATQQLKAWRAFLKRYFRERVRRGMLIEISPSGYGSRTLQGWHNIYDFTDDPELKYLVKSALDLWWAEWAQEQLGGMRGGGKTRLYPGAWALAHHDRNRAMSWFYLGQGRPAHHHETLPVIATTGYRLPLVVMDIALDPVGRGVYECKSRRLGRHFDYALSQSLSKPEEPIYDVDPEYGGIVRYSYCTPDFIMGTLMLESRPKEYWTAISQQNRWHGVVFAGREDSTLYPRCETDRSTYNGQWAIQHKGTLIAQKLRHSDNAGAMRVCFSTDLERHERDGWIFVRAARAFAAVKIVRGGWQWDDERWLRCDDEYTPVIIEVARSQDYNDELQSFEAALLPQSISFEDGVLRYSGLQGSGEFAFFAESDRLPELNGKPIDLAPDYAFASPFLNEKWASGVVRIGKGKRELVIDVCEDGGNVALPR